MTADNTNPQPIDIEHPKPEVLATMGDVFYVLQRSPYHQRLTLAQLRVMWEPPVHLGQVWVFRADGYPRGLQSFAFLSADAERRFAGEGVALRMDDWRSGDRRWAVETIVPYSNWRLMRQGWNWVCTTGFAKQKFRFQRLAPDSKPARIMESSFSATGRQVIRRVEKSALGA
ncbi:toxin-activating lysine-acyltransferase [Algicella marina]|uniref:RTX toxin-activating lysine-acyltransferase n=1 Tax=Algicella marina TaxID=2683284 RepID=A0A6P1T341_9RHOB|nr:toxin-activating lysine-acyltransferase [Algicella marina]QHQ35729.1 toxin-activating lysine-acyltransferase [Algicella marina]